MTSIPNYASLGLATSFCPNDTIRRKKQYMQDVIDGGFVYSRYVPSRLAGVLKFGTRFLENYQHTPLA